MKRLLLALLIGTASAQIPAPQLNLSGNIGCQGFPCVNSGTLVFSSDANRTMTVQETSAFYIKVTSSVSLTTTRNLVSPYGRFPFTIENATTGGQSVQIIGASGTGVTIPNGQTVSVWNDGNNYVQIGAAAVTSFSVGTWPSWLTPSVTNGTTTPSLSVSASPIPNSALANAGTTVNGQTCALGSTCTVTLPYTIASGSPSLGVTGTGCSVSSPVGGSTAGSFTLTNSSSSSCVLTVTLPSASHGWTCSFPAGNGIQTASTATTSVFTYNEAQTTGTQWFHCSGY